MPKVPLSHIFTALDQCLPRREKEDTEDESGFYGLTLLNYTHWEYNLPNLKEK